LEVSKEPTSVVIYTGAGTRPSPSSCSTTAMRCTASFGVRQPPRLAMLACLDLAGPVRQRNATY